MKETEQRDARRREGHVKTETEVGVMPPQVQKLLEPPEAVRSKKNPSPELFEGAKKLSCQRLDFGLWLPQLRGHKFLLFSSTKLVIMLQQPWEAGTLTVSYLTTVDLSCLT